MGTVNKLPISLCLIVKNEEKYLADCLASVKNLVSEMIVVDTGSTDRTVEIAKNFGARTFYFEWINDFSAARNYAIEQATQPWIFQLDADEELLAESADWFYTFFSGPNDALADGWHVEIRNLRYLNEPEVMVSHFLTRFYRNHPEVRYQFKIHENIMLRNNNRTGISKAVIIHKGYADPERKTEKAARNFKMLKQSLAANPNDPITNFYFAQQYFAIGERVSGYKAARKSLLQGATGIIKTNASRMVLSWTVDHGTPEQVAEAFSMALPDSVFPETLLYEGIWLLREQELDAAYLKFCAFVEKAARYKPGLGDDNVYPDNHKLGYELKAEGELRLGQVDEAIRSLDKALAISPTSWQTRAKRAQMLHSIGKDQDAIQEFERTIASIKLTSDSPWKATAIENFKRAIDLINTGKPVSNS